jgi:hypothetical protein
MKQGTYIRTPLYIIFQLVFAVSFPHFRSFLGSGIGKSISVLLFCSLLMFTIVRSADLYRTISSCLQALPLSWLAPVFDCGWLSLPAMGLLVPSEPALSPVAQRPPPNFS